MPLTVTRSDDWLKRFDVLESQRSFARADLAVRRRDRLLASPSGFFRGAPALFYTLLDHHQDVRRVRLRDARWIVGDVHFENIGVFSVGRHEQVFDFNDLDETVQGSSSLDVLRGATAAVVTAQERGLPTRDVIDVVRAFVQSWLRPVKAPPPPFVTSLLARASERKPHEVLDERCPMRGGSRLFAVGERYLALTDEERPVVEGLFERYVAARALPWIDKRLHLQDAAFRVQGTGSLGVRRFAMLVRVGGHGDHFLVEAKEMHESAVVRGGAARAETPRRKQAARVLEGMAALLPHLPAGATAITGSDRRSYVLRLQSPSEDKLALDHIDTLAALRDLAAYVGAHLAAAHTRARKRALPKMDLAATVSVAADVASAMTRTHLALVARDGA